MPRDESEILKEAIIKAHDLTLDEATRYRYQAIEKHIKERNTVLKERDIAVKERDTILAKLEQTKQQSKRLSQIIDQQSQIIKQLQQENDRLKAQQ